MCIRDRLCTTATGPATCGCAFTSLARLHGAYAIAVLSSLEPGRIVVAKHSSPLVLGIGEGATYCASDVPALLPYTRNMLFMEDGEMAVLEASGEVVTPRGDQPPASAMIARRSPAARVSNASDTAPCRRPRHVSMARPASQRSHGVSQSPIRTPPRRRVHCSVRPGSSGAATR